MQMSARLNIGARLMLSDSKWKFWKSGVENKVSGSGEFGLDTNYVPYNKKYLHENSTSRDFLESISYVIPISGNYFL